MRVFIFPDTNPHLIFNPNPKRKRFFIQMQPSQVDVNNTGRIHIGKGFQPVTTVGHNNQGEILIQSATIEEKKEFEGDTKPFKGALWGTSSVANQSIIFEEEIEERVI